MILKLSMNYYKLTIIINAFLLLGIFNNALSQQSSKYNLLEFPKNNQIEIDQYGYFYVIDQDNLIKYDSEGHTLYHYSNKLLGNIDQIDISNPLRPLLFYKDQGLIIVLDNTLSQQKEPISLNELGLYQTSCIANSNFDNGIWLYDIDVNEIIKINHLSLVNYRSGNLSVLIPNMEFPILNLKEKNRKLYVVTRNKIFVMDQFGSLLSVITLSAEKGLIIKEKNIITYDGNAICQFDFLDFKIDTLLKTKEYFKIMQLEDNIVAVSKNRSRINYVNLNQ
tara:strand:- start:3040 stop:3876 length:837 start_codon:yes stop_codon:yes gene_type:complete